MDTNRRRFLIGSTYAAFAGSSLWSTRCEASPLLFSRLVASEEFLSLVKFFAREALSSLAQELVKNFVASQFENGFSSRMSGAEWKFHRTYSCWNRFPSGMVQADVTSGKYVARIDEFLCSDETGLPGIGRDWNGPELQRATELRKEGTLEFFPWPSSIRRPPTRDDWETLRTYAKFHKYYELQEWLKAGEVEFLYARNFRTGPTQLISQGLLGCGIRVRDTAGFLFAKRSGVWRIFPKR